MDERPLGPDGGADAQPIRGLEPTLPSTSFATSVATASSTNSAPPEPDDRDSARPYLRHSFHKSAGRPPDSASSNPHGLARTMTSGAGAENAATTPSSAASLAHPLYPGPQGGMTTSWTPHHRASC